jgi:hypothetical protein
MPHSAPCTPKANSTNPIKYGLREVARARCVPASINKPIRSVQVAVILLMSRSLAADPGTPPTAEQVNSRP